ncbi:hypothetical protein [Haloarchaeobius sp. HRN-SO-5]|uniref:hypothetical protein n=1 Tax=Haloarchaeobius sp. HRN-SO-5 TaxID=3446118 RepID=UPI003EB9892E
MTPTLILVFSAEAWDVGLNLTNRTAELFAIGSVIAAAVHHLYVQRLTFPRERSQVFTEHKLQTVDHGQVVTYEVDRQVETAKSGILRVGSHSKYGFGELRV